MAIATWWTEHAIQGSYPPRDHFELLPERRTFFLAALLDGAVEISRDAGGVHGRGRWSRSPPLSCLHGASLPSEARTTVSFLGSRDDARFSSKLGSSSPRVILFAPGLTADSRFRLRFPWAGDRRANAHGRWNRRSPHSRRRWCLPFPRRFSYRWGAPGPCR